MCIYTCFFLGCQETARLQNSGGGCSRVQAIWTCQPNPIQLCVAVVVVPKVLLHAAHHTHTPSIMLYQTLLLLLLQHTAAAVCVFVLLSLITSRELQQYIIPFRGCRKNEHISRVIHVLKETNIIITSLGKYFLYGSNSCQSACCPQLRSQHDVSFCCHQATIPLHTHTHDNLSALSFTTYSSSSSCSRSNAAKPAPLIVIHPGVVAV